VQLESASYCKVNLWLEILGRRPDGYHELRTIFQSLDLADRIAMEIGGQDVELICEGRPIGEGENLAVRAARKFMQSVGDRRGVRIHLEKRIPVGAGLGGGSSNAAVTLVGLNRLYGTPLSQAQIHGLAAELGSDVGFFVRGGTAAAAGRGEEIHTLDDCVGGLEFLLVWPGFPVWTAEIYRRLQYPQLTLEQLTSFGVDTTIRRFREIVESGAWGTLRNDLEPVVQASFPACARIKETLLEAGCAGALLAGSGSTVFAVGDARQLDRAEERCLSHRLGETFRCRPVPASTRDTRM